MIVTPNTVRTSAPHLAQRLLGHLSQDAQTHHTAVTISVGVATIEPQRDTSATIERLLDTADSALRRAKSEGRNRVRVA